MLDDIWAPEPTSDAGAFPVFALLDDIWAPKPTSDGGEFPVFALLDDVRVGRRFVRRGGEFPVFALLDDAAPLERSTVRNGAAIFLSHKFKRKPILDSFTYLSSLKKTQKLFGTEKIVEILRKKRRKFRSAFFSLFFRGKNGIIKGVPGKDGGVRFPVAPQTRPFDVRPLSCSGEKRRPFRGLRRFLFHPFPPTRLFSGLFRFEYSRWPRKTN